MSTVVIMSACDSKEKFGSIRRLSRWVFFVLALAVIPAHARRIRIATYNVENGIGAPGSEKYEAQKAILRRINADVIAFQELTAGSSNHWVRLAIDLGYEHRAWGELGPFAGRLTVGYFSRFPIRAAASVPSPPEARELSRFPLRVTIAVSGAAHPLTIWNMHHKAMFEPTDDFRRAVEARRIANDVARHLAERPEESELLILGDMNDDPARREQSRRFDAVPERLPRTYALGSDIAFPLPYHGFPTTAYARAGDGFRAVPAFRAGSDIAVTHFYTNYRLDWVFASEALWKNPKGPPRGEVYHFEWDQPGVGLEKAGEPLPPELSLEASDHYPVFVDLHLTPAAEDGEK